MNKKLIIWQTENKDRLLNMGIVTENIRESPENILHKGVTVEHASSKCLGQVSAWESGLLDIEIIDIETEDRLLLEHYELKDDIDFNNILQKYIEIMISAH